MQGTDAGKGDIHSGLYSPSELLRSLEEEEDTVEWINSIIDSNHAANSVEPTYELADLEKCVSQLSASLELICEDNSSQLERTIEDITRTMSRLSYDFQFMRENVLSLQNALHTVEVHSKSTVSSHETSGVLERLHYLDTVKRNMTSSLAVLKEAESWSSLEEEVVSCLSEQEYTRAASRLAEASKSLGVFQNTPEYENRKNLLISLQNQLEASLSSALVAGISSGDVDLCKKYFDIFLHIDRESEFRSYWNGSKRKALVSVWEGVALQDCSEQENPPSVVLSATKFPSFLSTFFGELLNFAESERIAITQIFPDPQITLSFFVGSTISALHPSFAQRLASMARKYDDLALPELISSYKATQEFAVSMQKTMEKLGFSDRSPMQIPESVDGQSEPGSQLQRSHSRRRSQRLSFSRRLGHRASISGFGALSANNLDNSWGEALFEPFVDFQCDYAQLEKKYMSEQLRKTNTSSGKTSYSARILRERSVDLFAVLDGSVNRCVSFTHGYGLVGLLQAIDATVVEFMNSVRAELLRPGAASFLDSSEGMLGDDFAELDYSAEDYATFQATLHILEAIRGISERLTAFATKLRVQLLQTATFIRNTRNDPQGFYLSGTIKPAVDLLQTSALNNIELQTLVDNIDPENVDSSQQTPSTPNLATLFNNQRSQHFEDIQLIQGAQAAISEITKACQTKLQETILAPLFKHLNNYATSSLLTSEQASRNISTTGEIAIPHFSLSPTQAIQRVAEGLLNLPRLFEVYADDNALSFSLETLPFISSEIMRQFLDHSESTELYRDGRTDNRSRPKHLASPSLSLKPLSPPTETKTLAPETVSSAWLMSLTMTLLSHLTTNVLPAIKFLNDNGAAQLAEDIGYISQIVKAFNVEWKPLEYWRESITLDHAGGRTKLEEARSSGETDFASVLQMMGKMRGWPL